MGINGPVAAGPAQTHARAAAAAPSALTRSRPVVVREEARAAGARPRWSFGDLAIRPKLNVGAVDDPQERAADLAADHVMRMADPAVPVADTAPPKLRRQSSAGDEENRAERAPAEVAASASLADTATREQAAVSDAAPPMLPFQCNACDAEDNLRRAPFERAASAALADAATREQAGIADTVPPMLRRKSSACDAEDELQRAPVQSAAAARPAPGAASTGLAGDVAQGAPMEAPADVHAALAGSGVAMDAGLRAFFEPRFGQDFGHVRLHTDTVAAQSAQSAQSVGARAYTVGSDIVLGQGQYDAASDAGRCLLAHELAHVTQNDAGTARPVLRRALTHDGTATNCESAAIPLPAWLAGIGAHAQISLTQGILPQSIPRATKAGGALVGIPTPPASTPRGFADLWRHGGPGIEIGEIKSSSIGSTVAAREAAHYVMRHSEWLTREGSGAADAGDARYFPAVGGFLPAGPLNLAGTTGSDLMVGNFVLDPSKQLHIEADPAGAVIYWCTPGGTGGIPVVVPVLKKALDELAKKLQQAKKALQEAAGQAAEAARAIAKVVVTVLKALLVILLVLAAIALVVVALICLLGSPETFGLTLVCSSATLAAAGAAVDKILLLIGLPAMNLAAALIGAFNASNPATAAAATPGTGAAAATAETGANYDTEDDSKDPTVGAVASAAAAAPAGGVSAGVAAAGGAAGGAAGPASTPGDVLLAALNPIADKTSDPLGFVGGIKDALSGLDTGAVLKLNTAVAALDAMGDSATAGFLRDTITGTGMNQPGALAANDDRPTPDASALAPGAVAGAAPATPAQDNQAAPATAAG
jgi:hypothetical protein